MKKNLLKSKLKKNEVTYGSWITIPHLLVPEILAPAGFDWLTVDMEHSSIELGDLLPLIVAIEAGGMVPLVRVGCLDPNLIKRVMDAGAYGVIVADIRSAEQAEQAVAAVKYPPAGRRGVGLYRAQRFGREFEAYLKWLDEQSVVVVQIEHVAAVQNIDAILATPGVDAFMIGPYDLSGSMGMPGRLNDPAVEAAIQTVMDAGRRHGIPAGIHAVASDPLAAAQFRDQGFSFLAFSLDSIFLGDAVCAALAKLKGA